MIPRLGIRICDLISTFDIEGRQHSSPALKFLLTGGSYSEYCVKYNEVSQPKLSAFMFP
jgi:hypothetical protein